MKEIIKELFTVLAVLAGIVFVFVILPLAGVAALIWFVCLCVKMFFVS